MEKEIYSRVSTQAQNEDSFAKQRDLITDYTKSKGLISDKIDSTPTGDFLISMATAISEPQSDDMRKRMLSNMKHNSKQAYPYGYNQDGGVILVEKETIQRIAKLYMTGSDYEFIAIMLNEEGKLHRELSWSSVLVSQTLENPFYMGAVKMVSRTNPSQHVYVEGDHEAILTEEEFKNIQKR